MTEQKLLSSLLRGQKKLFPDWWREEMAGYDLDHTTVTLMHVPSSYREKSTLQLSNQIKSHIFILPPTHHRIHYIYDNINYGNKD